MHCGGGWNFEKPHLKAPVLTWKTVKRLKFTISFKHPKHFKSAPDKMFEILQDFFWHKKHKPCIYLIIFCCRFSLNRRVKLSLVRMNSGYTAVLAVQRGTVLDTLFVQTEKAMTGVLEAHLVEHASHVLRLSPHFQPMAFRWVSPPSPISCLSLIAVISKITSEKISSISPTTISTLLARLMI